jgi:hypothetical protein
MYEGLDPIIAAKRSATPVGLMVVLMCGREGYQLCGARMVSSVSTLRIGTSRD